MLFTSAMFLFFFLPAVLLLYFSVRGTSAGSTLARNSVLLAASTFFYLWGEFRHAWLIGLLIIFNYFAAIGLGKIGPGSKRRLLLLLACALNLLALIRFKYGAFLAENWNHAAANFHWQEIAVREVALPLGISFFVFHCISYLVDIYRGNASAQKNPVDMALYIALFPQLIAGPIIRYSQICDQIIERTINAEKFAMGVQRFLIGLGKKLILANSFAMPADAIFALEAQYLSPDVAWLGAALYSLQLYFDFSGYSDMAIGLGLMFGFKFPENFNYPYVSQSIKEFWQRWHMTLSGWFRDYVYIPLGGNRHGQMHTAVNLVTVFFLCGLWHGANWTFIVWGLYHGFFLSIERLGLAALLNKIGRPFRHAYTVLVVVIGWVFFRSETVDQALNHLRIMWSWQKASAGAPEISRFLTGELIFLLLIAVLASTPIIRALDAFAARKLSPTFASAGRVAALTAIMCMSLAEVNAGSYNPFIYFHF